MINELVEQNIIQKIIAYICKIKIPKIKKKYSF